MSGECPHTSRSRSARDSTTPGRRTNASSRSNSFGASATGAPPRVTTRERGSIATSSKPNDSPGVPNAVIPSDAREGAAPARRSSAPTRATSSEIPNGFVT